MNLRVYSTYPTNWGEDKLQIKLFSDKKKADAYFFKIEKEMRAEVKNTDDVLSVVLEDVKTGKKLRYAQSDDGG